MIETLLTFFAPDGRLEIALLSWIATILTVFGVGLCAANSRQWSKFCWPIQFVGNFFWIAAGIMTPSSALVALNGAFLLVNVWGMWRWWANPPAKAAIA